jgi:hypothetical protein
VNNKFEETSKCTVMTYFKILWNFLGWTDENDANLRHDKKLSRFCDSNR